MVTRPGVPDPGADGRPMVSRDRTAAPADPGQAETLAAMSFAGTFMADLKGSAATTMVAIGARLNWLSIMDEVGPVSSSDLAKLVGAQERYVREWLLTLHSAGYVQHVPGTARFFLPPAAANVLAREDSPFYSGGVARLLPALVSRLDQLIDDLPSGAGITQQDYPDELFEAMRRTHTSWLTRMLVQHWLPKVRGLEKTLAGGGRGAHVACGSGAALILLAQEYPASRFTGYDPLPANIDAARAAAARAGVTERVELVVADGWEADLGTGVDLVIALDSLHEAKSPARALRAVRDALAPDGVLLLLEPDGAVDELDNHGEAITLLYATSMLYTVPTALARHGSSVGMLGLPEQRLRELCGEAGLLTFRPLLEPGPFNKLYEIRKGTEPHR